MKVLILATALLFIHYIPAVANPVVADLSTYRISIDAGFNGIRMFIFGARNESGDIVVVIRGPEKRFVVRKKERIAGIWVNRRQIHFNDVPDFYAIASSRPLMELGADALLRQMKIGSRTLLTPPSDIYEQALYPDFSDAFFLHQQMRKLYTSVLPLNFMGETLFKTVVPFPDTIPRGEYIAEIYLISDGQLTAMQSIPIRVEKTGFDAMVYDMAHRQPLLYGLCAVALALLAGWMASRLFEKV